MLTGNGGWRNRSSELTQVFQWKVEVVDSSNNAYPVVMPDRQSVINQDATTGSNVLNLGMRRDLILCVMLLRHVFPEMAYRINLANNLLPIRDQSL